jgi:hypothetical protein
MSDEIRNAITDAIHSVRSSGYAPDVVFVHPTARSELLEEMLFIGAGEKLTMHGKEIVTDAGLPEEIVVAVDINHRGGEGAMGFATIEQEPHRLAGTEPRTQPEDAGE